MYSLHVPGFKTKIASSLISCNQNVVFSPQFYFMQWLTPNKFKSLAPCVKGKFHNSNFWGFDYSRCIFNDMHHMAGKFSTLGSLYDTVKAAMFFMFSFTNTLYCVNYSGSDSNVCFSSGCGKFAFNIKHFMTIDRDNVSKRFADISMQCRFFRIVLICFRFFPELTFLLNFLVQVVDVERLVWWTLHSGSLFFQNVLSTVHKSVLLGQSTDSTKRCRWT